MENKGTGADDSQGGAGITDLTKGKGEGNEIPFDLGSLGAPKVDSPEAIQAAADAKKLAEDKAKAEKEAADKLAASGGAGGADDNKDKFFESDGKKFKLDENGNALNEDGTVFKTKEEVDTITAEVAAKGGEGLPPLIEEIIQLNGVEILDDKGKPKVYEDTTEGLIQYTKDFAALEVANSQKEFFDKLPQVKEFAQHILRGGKEEDFYKAKTASWKNFTLDETNEAQLIDVIAKDLQAKNFSKEEIDDHIKLYKDSNKLIEKGKAAVESRKKDEIIKDKDKAEKELKDAKDWEATVNAHWTEVNNVIKTGKLENIVIPETDKDAFFKYISVAVDKQGNSQYDIDERTAKPENDLQYKYLRFKNFNIDKLIKNAAATERAKSLRDRVRKDGVIDNGNGETTQEKVKPGDVSITLNGLLGAPIQ